MLLTEEQAREKWCPQGRKGWVEHADLAVSGYSTNDPTDPPDNRCRCVASRCMMWRWYGKNCAHELPPKPSEASKPNKVDCDCLPKGYCGLAGKP